MTTLSTIKLDALGVKFIPPSLSWFSQKSSCASCESWRHSRRTRATKILTFWLYWKASQKLTNSAMLSEHRGRTLASSTHLTSYLMIAVLLQLLLCISSVSLLPSFKHLFSTIRRNLNTNLCFLKFYLLKYLCALELQLCFKSLYFCAELRLAISIGAGCFDFSHLRKAFKEGLCEFLRSPNTYAHIYLLILFIIIKLIEAR